jgi:hypothetical protein
MRAGGGSHGTPQSGNHSPTPKTKKNWASQGSAHRANIIGSQEFLCLPVFIIILGLGWWQGQELWGTFQIKTTKQSKSTPPWLHWFFMPRSSTYNVHQQDIFNGHVISLWCLTWSQRKNNLPGGTFRGSSFSPRNLRCWGGRGFGRLNRFEVTDILKCMLLPSARYASKEEGQHRVSSGIVFRIHSWQLRLSPLL